MKHNSLDRGETFSWQYDSVDLLQAGNILRDTETDRDSVTRDELVEIGDDA